MSFGRWGSLFILLERLCISRQFHKAWGYGSYGAGFPGVNMMIGTLVLIGHRGCDLIMYRRLPKYRTCPKLCHNDQ
jgi:hypothetical protein